MKSLVKPVQFDRVALSPENNSPSQAETRKARWAHLKAALSKLGMITSEEALRHSGLALGHDTAIRLVAKNLDTVVAIRPVNDKATLLIASLSTVKGRDDTHLKTAATGPMAGFIPVDPRLGKLGLALLENRNANPNPVFTLDSTKPGIVASPLTICENRRNELFDKGVMTRGRNNEVLCGGPHPSSLEQALNAHFEFRLNDLHNGDFAVQYRNKTTSGNQVSFWKNVDVVAKQAGPGYPVYQMTADYDILGYFPHLSNFRAGTLPSRNSKISVRENFQHLKEHGATPAQFKKALFRSVTGKVREEMLGQSDRRNPSPSRGAFTLHEEFISEKLNKALRPEVYDRDGKEKPDSAGVLIKHGTEMNNPHPENDAQVTILGPKKIFFVTRSQEQLNQALSLIRSHGFLVYTNRQWDSTRIENALIQAGKSWRSHPMGSSSDISQGHLHKGDQDD